MITKKKNLHNVVHLMDLEIKVEVKYGWLHSRRHAKMYACAKYHHWRANSYWETDLNPET